MPPERFPHFQQNAPILNWPITVATLRNHSLLALIRGLNFLISIADSHHMTG